MQKILFIAHSLPTEGSGGNYKVRSTLQALSTIAAVDVACVYDPRLSGSTKELQSVSSIVRLILFPKKIKTDLSNFHSWMMIGKSLFSLQPYRTLKYHSEDLVRWLRKSDLSKYHAVVLDSFPSLMYLEYFTQPTFYLEHNVDSKLARDFIDFSHTPWSKAFWFFEYLKTVNFEKKILPKVSRIWAINAPDKKQLEKIKGTTVSLLPTFIYAHQKISIYRKSNKKIVFTGLLSWYPNLVGLKWFLKECWPLVKRSVPGVKLVITGLNAGDDLLKLVQRDATVDYRGYVKNLHQLYINCSVGIAPILFGSGLSTKVLHYMSSGLPVVSTPEGARGLKPSKALIISGQETFADTLIQLLDSNNHQKNLKKTANKYIHDNYSLFSLTTFLKKELKLP